MFDVWSYVRSPFSELHDVAKRSGGKQQANEQPGSTIVDTSLWATAVAVATGPVGSGVSSTAFPTDAQP